jgi:hypothetical protein
MNLKATLSNESAKLLLLSNTPEGLTTFQLKVLESAINTLEKITSQEETLKKNMWNALTEQEKTKYLSEIACKYLTENKDELEEQTFDAIRGVKKTDDE